MYTVTNFEYSEKPVINLYEKEGLISEVITEFQTLIWEYYHKNGRKFPWRETYDPYHILVSEIMLQQTQTSRLLKKYKEFLSAFPTVEALANASLVDVLRIWQGMGYNRRAVALHRIARTVIDEFDGEIPASSAALRTLPGVGSYTASAILAIAFNQPEVCIETNIRTVFTYFFFHDKDKVTDRDVLSLIEATLDRTNPREWYYALFDYGAMLKTRSINLNSKSIHYRKQSEFEGSNREMRGQILRVLLSRSLLSKSELVAETKGDYKQVLDNVQQLQTEGFLTIDGDTLSIA